MSTQRVSVTIPASGIYSVGAGNFFLLLTSTGSLDIRVERGGVAEKYTGIIGGLRLARLNPWTEIRVLGGAGTVFDYFIGDEIFDHDDTDIRLQIATIAGVAAVSFAANTSLTNAPAVAAANGAQSVLFAANPLRKKISVTCDSDNASGPGAKAFARTVGGANNIQELQPGSVYDFTGTFGVDVRNDTGGIATFYLKEEA